MPLIASDVRSLAREHTTEAIRHLASIMRHSDSDGVRVSACALLLERGWGKAPQAVTGENGEGGIEVIVRHIIEGAGDRAKVITQKK